MNRWVLRLPIGLPFDFDGGFIVGGVPTLLLMESETGSLTFHLPSPVVA